MVTFVCFLAFAILIFEFVISVIFLQDLHVFDQISTYIDAIVFYIGQVIDIVWIFVPKKVTILCMTFTIGANLFRWGYKFVMWMLHKIPFVHID